MAGATFRRRDKKFSKKLQRTLDPAMLLSRGLSARFVGANVMQSITTLSKEEIDKDLRHMNAYYQANVAYAQQHFIYMNREKLGAAGQLPAVAGGANQAATAGAVASPSAAGAAGFPTPSTPVVAPPPIAMPVRIDPEEEKRLSNLRKRIALCETQREFLESQYVSLRAHYVATTKELKAASKNAEGLLLFLKAITQRKARVLALQRARLQIARDVLACLQTRFAVLEAAQLKMVDGGTAAAAADSTMADANAMKNDDKMDTDSPVKLVADERTNHHVDSDVVMKTTPMATAALTGASASALVQDDIADIWNELEDMLREAELACRRVPSTLAISEKKAKKKVKKGSISSVTDIEDEQTTTIGVIPWEGIKLPITPEGVPLMLSQLSLVPEKSAAYSTNGAFGSHKYSMAWMESNLPKTHNAKGERQKVLQLRDEVALLEDELAKERAANKVTQVGIIGRRRRSDELVAMMTLLRSETEAILQRHNILLDSPQAKQAARDLHEELLKKRAKAAAAAQESGDGDGGVAAINDGDAFEYNKAKKSPDINNKEKSRSTRNNSKDDGADDENDGDDEGDGAEDFDEEGEIKGAGGGWVGKRDLEVGPGGDSSPTTGRKRRKV